MSLLDKSSKEWLFCALTLILWCCVSGCRKEEKEDNGNDTEKMKLSTVKVSEGYLEDELVLNANVVYDENRISKIYVPCRGKIHDIKVEKGDFVVAGQPLAFIYSQDAAEYDKQLSDALSEIRLAKRELSMKKDMYESGMASEKEVAEAQSRVDMALSERERLQSVAGVNGYSDQSYATMKAPISGYIFEKNIYKGSYIDDTNNDIPAFEIADLKSVWIVADVYESDIWQITQGEEVYITVLAYPDMKLEGKIDKLYHNLNDGSKTMKVRVNLDNKDGKLMPGMFVNVHVKLSGFGRKMMQVPSGCVVFENGNNYVVTVDGQGKFHRQKVKVLHQTEQTVYIESGVSIGEPVVCENTLLLFNDLR